MSYSIYTNGLQIPYEIQRTRRKTYGIHINPGGIVTVRIPLRGTISFAQSMMEEKKRLGLSKLS